MYEKENQEGLCQQVKMDDKGTTFEHNLNDTKNAIIADRHSGNYSWFLFSSTIVLKLIHATHYHRIYQKNLLVRSYNYNKIHIGNII